MKEHDIRPDHLFEELLRLSRQDIDRFFTDVPRDPIVCPACEGRGEVAIEKSGFTYEECPECLTLFVSPRPRVSAFERYYRESESSRYWATTFYKATEAARREKLWRPKAQRVLDILDTWVPDGVTPAIFDVGGGYGIFAEEMKRLGRTVTVIEPAPHLAAVCREKDLEVIEAFLEDVGPDDLGDGAKVFTSFELFEHLHDPGLFLLRLRALMRPGDLFVFTTLSGTGLDIRVLWEASKSISPPHHLNFFNPASAARLLARTGFECLDAATPGVLDVDILRNGLGDVKDRFWRAFLETASDEARAEMQRTITETGFSSHMMLVARATGE